MKSMLKRHMRFWMNLWPPFLGAGIRVTRLDRNWRAIDVEMKLRFWNRNYVGTHYGGSIYSMTDPFHMLMLLENLGRDYIIWDKAATIRFRKPGTGRVTASFRISDAEFGEIRNAVQASAKIERTFTVHVKDPEGTVIAEVEKVIYVRRK